MQSFRECEYLQSKIPQLSEALNEPETTSPVNDAAGF